MTATMTTPVVIPDDAEQWVKDVLSEIAKHAEVVIPDVTQVPREEWLEKRREGIGGSDAAGVVGLSPYDSPRSVWLDKAQGLGEKAETSAMRAGKLLEPAIVQWIGEDEGIPVYRYPAMLRSKEWPWMQVDLDGLAPEAVVEAKNVHGRKAEEWEDGAVPGHYAIQGQHSDAVVGLPKTMFGALIGGQQLTTVEVPRDPALIESLVEHERKFWELVLANTPPAEVDGSDATARALAIQYAHPNAGSRIELPSVLREHIEAVKSLRAQKKALDIDIKAYENVLKDALGDYEIGMIDGIDVVTWKSQDRIGYYVDPTTFRVLRLPKPDGMQTHTRKEK